MADPADRQRVLITGHCGFTGRHAAAAVRAAVPGAVVCGADRAEGAVAGIDEAFTVDLLDADQVERMLADVRPHVVLHLAGSMPPAPDVALWAGNVGTTCNLLEALRRMESRSRVLVIGSAAEYGATPPKPVPETRECRPQTPYGRAKLAQTLLCQRYTHVFGLPVVIARPFNLFGPGMPARTLIGETCAQLSASSDGEIKLGNLSSARDFVDIRDAVNAYWRIAMSGLAGEVYNVCRALATPVREVVETLVSLAGNNYRVVFEESRLQAGDVDMSCGDNGKLRSLATFEPRDLHLSLRETLASFRREQH